MQVSITRRIRQQFAVQIRRQKKQQYFSQRRLQLQDQLLHKNQLQMLSRLQNSQSRQQWIQEKGRNLTGIPNQIWKFQIQQLNQGILCFKDSFRLWVELGLVRNLCMGFQFDYVELGLAPQIADLLATIIHFQCQNNSDQVANEIMNQQILPNLMQLAQQPIVPLNDTYYLILIGNLALFEFKQVIRAGGLKVFIDWGARLIHKGNYNRDSLQVLYRFLNLVVNRQKRPKGYELPSNHGKCILALASQLISINQSQQLLLRLLKIIQQISSYNQQKFYVQFVSNPLLLTRLFSLSTHNSQLIRKTIWKTLSFLSSTKQQISPCFESNHLLQNVVQAYGKDVQDTENWESILESMVLVVNNFVEEGDLYREIVLNSKVFGIVMDAAHFKQANTVRHSAVFCLVSLSDTDNYQIYKMMVFQSPFLKYIINALKTVAKEDVIVEILGALIHLIEMDSTIYRQEGNLTLNILESNFDINNVINQIQLKFDKSAKIHQMISLFIDICSRL